MANKKLIKDAAYHREPFLFSHRLKWWVPFDGEEKGKEVSCHTCIHGHLNRKGEHNGCSFVDCRRKGEILRTVR